MAFSLQLCGNINFKKIVDVDAGCFKCNQELADIVGFMKCSECGGVHVSVSLYL